MEESFLIYQWNDPPEIRAMVTIPCLLLQIGHNWIEVLKMGFFFSVWLSNNKSRIIPWSPELAKSTNQAGVSQLKKKKCYLPFWLLWHLEPEGRKQSQRPRIPSPFPTSKARTSAGWSACLLLVTIVILNQHITAELKNLKCVDILAFGYLLSPGQVPGPKKGPQVECEQRVERIGLLHSSCQGIFSP